MVFPVKTCVVCEEEFELRPGKPGYANRCPACSVAEGDEEKKAPADAFEGASRREANAARRAVMKDMLYSGK